MNKIIILCFTILTTFNSYANDFPAHCSVRFSPNGGALESIVNRINLAEKEILLQAYNYTSPEIADALISAKHRGVEVIAIIDGKQVNGNGSKIRFSYENGLPIFLDKKHTIAHNKTIIIDGIWTHTGSFNFSNNAEKRNAENSVWCNSQEMSKIYKQEFLKHLEHSDRVTSELLKAYEKK